MTFVTTRIPKRMSDLYQKRKEYQAAVRRREREYSDAAVENVKMAAEAVLADDVKEAYRGMKEQFNAGANKLGRGAREVYQGAVEAYRGDVPSAAKEAGLGAMNVATGGLQSLISPFTGPIEAFSPDLGITEAAMNYVDGTRAG